MVIPEASSVMRQTMRQSRSPTTNLRKPTKAPSRGSPASGESSSSSIFWLGKLDLESRAIAAHRQGVIPRQRDFAEELGISNASVSVLIDRLCRDGYAERIVHPADRRSVGIVPTEYSDTEVRGTRHRMHERMMDAAGTLSEDERVAVAKFLEAMISSVEIDDKPSRPSKGKPVTAQNAVPSG